MSNPRPARLVCANLLARWLEAGDFPDRQLSPDHPAAPLIQEMAYGCLRWKGPLVWRLQQLAPRKPDDQTLAFLLIGLYQLFYLDHVPPHAAVHETVEAAKSVLDPARCRFLNAVLRNALRKQDALNQQLDSAPLDIRLSHPPVLIERWTSTFGQEATEALCNWNNTRPSVSLRLFPRIPASQTLAESLPPHPADPERFRIVPPGAPLQQLAGFEAGACYFQDPATAIAVDLLDVQPGVRLLDACAAPGGKAFACADQMQDQGEIVAMDCYADRLQRLKQNLARMRFTCIHILKGDATQPDCLPASESFDRILLDVPCSNTGVLQRRPDARWRFSQKRLRSLVQTQRCMLDTVAPHLKPGGFLVYSTCSIEPEENQQLVERWVAEHSDFTLGPIRYNIPPQSGMDGAFAARIIRKHA